MLKERNKGDLTKSAIFWILILGFSQCSFIENKEIEQSGESEIVRENCTVTTTHNINVIKTRTKKGFSIRKYIQRIPDIEYYKDVEKVNITTCCDGYQWQVKTNFCEPLCFLNCFEETTMKESLPDTTLGYDDIQEVKQKEETKEEDDSTTAVSEQMNCPEGHIYYHGACKSLDECHFTGCSVNHSICSENGDCVCENDYDSYTKESKLVKCLVKVKSVVINGPWLNMHTVYFAIATFIVSSIMGIICYACSRNSGRQMEVEGKNLQCVYMKTTDAKTSKDIVFQSKNIIK